MELGLGPVTCQDLLFAFYCPVIGYLPSLSFVHSCFIPSRPLLSMYSFILALSLCHFLFAFFFLLLNPSFVPSQHFSIPLPVPEVFSLSTLLS